MAKSRKARGKEPAKAPGRNNDDNFVQLTRDAQAHYVKNRGRKRLVPDEQLDNDDSFSDEGSKLEDETGSDDNIDDTAGGYYAHEAEDDDISDSESQLDDEEASILELQEQLRAKQAALQRRKKATTSAALRADSLLENPTPTTSGRSPAKTSARTSTAAPAPARAAAPARARTLTPAPAIAPAPTVALDTPTAPADDLSTRLKEVQPLVWPGGKKRIPLPRRKVDYSMRKIREGLGALDDRPGWNKAKATVRNGIVRCGLDTKKPWTRQDPTKVGMLLPILNTLIPGFENFEDNWAALFMVQSNFNNARATQLKLEREVTEQQATANHSAPQVDLDAPALQRFDTPHRSAPELENPPGPASGQQRVTQASPSRRASGSRRQRTAVPTGVSADDFALAQASLPPVRVPLPISPPTPAANVPLAGPVPVENPKGRPRPKMRPPPANDDEPVLDTPLTQPVPRHPADASAGNSRAGDQLPLQTRPPRHAPTKAPVPGVPRTDLPSKVSGPTKAKAAGAKGRRKAAPSLLPLPPPEPTGWPDPPVTPRSSSLGRTSSIMEVAMRSPQRSSSSPRSPQHPPSRADAPPTGRVLVPDTQSQSSIDNPTVEKPSPLKSRTERESVAKQSRPQGPAADRTAATEPPANTPGASVSSATDRRSGLRSGRAAAAAAAAVEQTANVRQKQQSKKRPGSSLKEPQSKKAKGKKQTAPPSSLPSEPLQPEPEDRSENDDGFHSPDED